MNVRAAIFGDYLRLNSRSPDIGDNFIKISQEHRANFPALSAHVTLKFLEKCIILTFFMLSMILEKICFLIKWLPLET